MDGPLTLLYTRSAVPKLWSTDHWGSVKDMAGVRGSVQKKFTNYSMVLAVTTSVSNLIQTWFATIIKIRK